jgi:3-deoxy-D-manno-octulosonate 8-phosphate phosphatase (KDO 8-P phosphatase)
MDFPTTALTLAHDIRLLIVDVDGVLTDGRIYYGASGEELKAFNTQDGVAAQMLMASGVQVAVITGRSSSVVSRRATELGIQHVYQGAADKAAVLDALAAATGISASAMAHAGDDLPDLRLFARVGAAFAVPHAHPAVIERADYVTRTAGGHGAVRELCQLIMTAQETWDRALAAYLE